MQQRPLIGSALLGETGSGAPPLVFDRRGDTHFEACVGLPRAPYLIAVASDREPPPLPPSLYVDRSDLDTAQARFTALDSQLRQTQTELSRTQEALSQTNAELGRVKAASTQMQAELDRATANGREATLRAQQAEHARLVSDQRNDALREERDFIQRQHDLMQGSLRTFVRGYLPRLRRHLRGRRP